MEDVKDVVLQLRYRTTYARVLDANRKFLEAALRYYDLSQTQKKEVSQVRGPCIRITPPLLFCIPAYTPLLIVRFQEDLMELLGKSVTCAILGKAGPQRSRILGTLFKDERINSLETLSGYDAHAKVLNKMYMEQIIKKPELSAFEASLMPHQKVVLGE
jgi:COP9 signalosome complex subunit 4